jgi:hypothetical protein
MTKIDVRKEVINNILATKQVKSEEFGDGILVFAHLHIITEIEYGNRRMLFCSLS